jgi:hypothetical protein
MLACPQCGSTDGSVKIKGRIWWGVLGFFLPPVGLILYLAWRKTCNHRAGVAGKGAIIGTVIFGALYIIYYAIACSNIAETATAFLPFL